MSTTASTETATAVDLLLAQLAAARPTAEPFAPDALFDAVVPGWRFQVEGADRIALQLAEWFADPTIFDEVRRRPTPDGEVVEMSFHWDERGERMSARQVHVIELDGEGRIARDAVWCGGRWDAARAARMGL